MDYFLNLDIFAGKIENKIAELSIELSSSYNYGNVEECIVDKINLLADGLLYILNEDNSDDSRKEVISILLDEGCLDSIASTVFNDYNSSIIIPGEGSGGGAPAEHRHPDEDIDVALTSATETVGGCSPADAIIPQTLEELLMKIFNKYQSPSWATYSSNLSSEYEVGQTVSGNIELSWIFNNGANLLDGATSGNIIVSEADVITPTGNFNIFGTTGKTLSFIDPYVKNTVGSLTISTVALNSEEQVLPTQTTTSTWKARVYWLNSINVEILASDVQTAVGTSVLSTSRSVPQFTVSGSGYKYVFIPDMLSQAGIKFVDPNSGFEIAMNDAIDMTVTNPQGLAIDGKLYRTKNSLGSSLTINIS